jgi:hypothetical protein
MAIRIFNSTPVEELFGDASCAYLALWLDDVLIGKYVELESLLCNPVENSTG